MEEEILVERMKTGDKVAFDMLYERYKDIAFRTSYLIVGNKADSEDIVQETFIKCYQNISSLKHNDRFKSWFFQILTRTAWANGKKKSHEIPQEDMTTYLNTNISCSAADMVMKKEQTSLMMSLINDLPEKQRIVVVLYYYNEFSTKEIAKMIGCLEGTVKSRLHSARKNLKNILLTQEGAYAR